MNDKGEVILELLHNLPSKPLTDIIRPLYEAAYERRTKPEEAVKLCEKALEILERLPQRTLPDAEEMCTSKGICHLLLASIYLNEGTELKEAEKHYSHSKDEFHLKQWSHLESLAHLGLAITRRRLRKYEGAIIACKSAQDSIQHQSIPSSIDTKKLSEAINKERLEIQKLLSQECASEVTRIPIVSDIAAGLGRIAEENIEECLCLNDNERKGADFGVRVVGDSMKDKGILPDSIALIRKQEKTEIGEIVAAVITTRAGDEGVLKIYRYHRRQGNMRHALLESSNPLSEHLVVIPSGADVEKIKTLYATVRQQGRIRNRIIYYENAELVIAGKYVGFVRKHP